MKFVMTALLAAASALAQVAGPANAGYRTPEGRAQVAAGLGAPDRDARQKPRELVAALDLKPGMTVVDLGTGVGYMLPHLSAAVGAGGSVIAEDIQQDFLDKAKAKARQEHLETVQFVLGTDRDPRLPANSADLILVLDAYHHFDYPQQMLAKLSEALKPSGRLAIVEYYKRRGAMGAGDPDRPLSHIRLDADDVVKEVESNGFRLLKRQEHVPGSQYIAIFEKKRM
jgi:ubiquinone/menaquinone biosynthesis C-methylase UbiE